MYFKLLLGAVLIFFAAIVITFNALATLTVQRLILCATDNSQSTIPSAVCKYYLENHGIDGEAVRDLQAGAGLEFILNIESPSRFELAERFIEQGLDVNGINHYSSQNSAPLHAAIMYGDLDSVKFLIAKGALLSVKNKSGETALQLAERLFDQNNLNGQAIISQLTLAESRP
ncbi:ankyrin repeat domain-containing protein [Neptunomonas phycophila]|uniref:ankyrin repeat domain-containing protein n=1 Tax=Neptunomonas phycophila TaxID=1572645 RepID=UPI000948A2F8|nr:ankyrin repeat domain-containing protein [Neptunomonas phycophila]